MRKISFSIVVVFILSAAVSAQSIAFGPQVGFIKTTKADKATVMPGAALRINLLGLSAEGSIYYKAEEFENGAIKTTSYPFMLTGMLNILPIIHAEAGIGYYNTKIEYSGIYGGVKSETKNDVGYHVGAGAELPLGNLLLTGDVRYVFLNYKLDNPLKITELKSDFYVIMVGAMFKL